MQVIETRIRMPHCHNDHDDEEDNYDDGDDDDDDDDGNENLTRNCVCGEKMTNIRYG